MDKRIRWLDAAKGLGILFVVAGHSIPGIIKGENTAANAVSSFIYYFHMPFLVFLSGYSFRISENRYAEERLSSFLKRKALALLLPYMAYCTLIYLLFMSASLLPMLRGIMEAAGYGPIGAGKWLMSLALGSNSYCQHMWYLYALFFYTAVCYLLLKAFPGKKGHQTAAAIVVAGILLLVSYQVKWEKREGTDSVLFYFQWFVLGWKIKIPEVKKICAWMGLALSFLGLSFMAFAASFVKELLYMDSLIKYLLHMLIKLLIVYFLIEILIREERENRILHWLGTRSMEIYLFSQPFFGACLSSVLYMMGVVPIPVIVAASIVLSIFVPVFFSSMILGRARILRSLFGLRMGN